MRRSRHSSCDDVVLGNMDLMGEILLRLPVKQVLRCKCVCKKWLALISDPQFCHSHTLRLCSNNSNYPRALLLKQFHGFLRDLGTFHVVPFANSNNDAIASPSPERIIQLNVPYPRDLNRCIKKFSCNGLLLWTINPYTRNYSYSISDEEEQKCYPPRSFIDVCNPATGHYVRLNYPSDKNFNPPDSIPFLAFEPLISRHFKVILFYYVSGETTSSDDDDETGAKHEISLYSSEKGSWSDAGVCVYTRLYVKKGVYCKGAIHWYNPEDHENLVYFDVHQVRFKEIPGPPAASVDDSSDLKLVSYFGESGGHLHLIQTNNNQALEFDIWELQEDYSGWVVRYHVDFNFLAERIASEWPFSPFRLLCVVRQANEEDSMLLFFLGSKIMTYNLRDHSTRFFYEVHRSSLISIQYFETLSCTGLGSKLILPVTAQEDDIESEEEHGSL